MMASPSFNERTESFLKWFKSIPGATFSDSIQIVDLRSRNAGRGIVATRDISPETTLFTIPRQGIISTETSKLQESLPNVFGGSENDEDEEMSDGWPEMDSWSSLILVMMHEYLKGKDSQWEPYFDILPETFDTPMFWSEDEVKELQASAMRSKIGKADAEAMFREKLLPIIRGRVEVFASSSEMSDEGLIQLAHRMGSTIMAYAFDLENDDDREDDESDGWVEDRDGKSLMGMVPMADILNADAEFNAHVNHGDDELTVTALRPIKAGEEILNYYGPHPNSELLRRYGYVTAKHSRYDVVEIPWEVVEAAMVSHLGITKETLEQVRTKIDKEDLEDTFVLERQTGDPNPDGTFASPATITELPEDLEQQLKDFLKAVSKIDTATIPDKRKRDEMHREIIAKALQDLEARYPTSVQEDERLIMRGGVEGRPRMALEVRVGEKRLLREARAFVGREEGVVEEEGPQKRAKV